MDSPWSIQQAVERVFDSDDLPVQLAHRILDDCTDDCVEPGSVTPSGEDSNSMSCHEQGYTTAILSVCVAFAPNASKVF